MAQNPHASQSEDNALFWLLAAAGAYLALTYLARHFEAELNTALGALRYAQLYPFAYLSSLAGDATWLSWLKGGWFDAFFLEPAAKAVDWLEHNPFSRMSVEHRAALATIAGRCLAPIYIPLLFWLLTLLRSLRPDLKFRGTQTLESMIWESSEHWLTSRQARHIDPLRLEQEEEQDQPTPVVLPEARPGLIPCEDQPLPALATEAYLPAVQPRAASSWSPALRPEEWLERQVVAPQRDTRRYLPDDLRACFQRQLCRPWTSFRDLDLPLQAIVAACAFYHAGKVQDGVDLLEDLALLYDTAGRKSGMKHAISADRAITARIRDTIAGPAAKALEEIAAHHAFVETALVRVLIESRTNRGVLASASFLWLKSEDRPLWYALNNAGGNAFHVECAAVMSHFKAEIQMRRPIHTPVVRYAAIALEIDYLDLAPARVARREQRLPKPAAGDLLREAVDQLSRSP